jgi:hypothetical protein
MGMIRRGRMIGSTSRILVYTGGAKGSVGNSPPVLLLLKALGSQLVLQFALKVQLLL